MFLRLDPWKPSRKNAKRELGKEISVSGLLSSMVFKKRLDVVPSKPDHPTDLVGNKLTAFDPPIDGHLGHAEKLGELFDGVKLLGQLSHHVTC